MILYYDLHIHSALSPCADNDMTPNNIVNMALLKELDIIAVADHNSCGNLAVVLKACEGTPLTVVPAMEVETAEEVHVLCYFPTLEAAQRAGAAVAASMPSIPNRPEIFGGQYYMDSEDNILAEEESLLITASGISIDKLFPLISEAGGIAVPAHIDKSSNSILSNLGFIAPELSVSAVEIRERSLSSFADKYDGYKIITNSDAHTLGDISERLHSFSLQSNTPAALIDYLRKNN